MFLRTCALLFLLCCFITKAQAQSIDSLRQVDKRISIDTSNMQDTTNLPTDQEIEESSARTSRKQRKAKKEEEPVVYKDSARLTLENRTRQAVRSSAILPGLGQVQNGRWWKVPMVYGGFVGLGLFFEFNQ